MAEFKVVQTISVDCAKCGSPRVWKTGKQGAHQRFICRDCGAKFRAGGMTSGHRYEAEGIALAIRSFFSGKSYRAISQSLGDFYDVPKPSTSTLYDWVHRYSLGAADILRQYPATTGGHWAADEIEYTIGKDRPKKDRKKFWMWVVIDKSTRYLLAIHVAWSKDAEQAKVALQKALAVASAPPAKITTDGAHTYPPAIRAVLPETRHIESEGIRSFINNNLCERMNGTVRQRTKVLRGVNDLETAQIMMDGWRLHYNFFRDHEGINGRKPAVAAKIDSPFKEWADVVRAKAKAPKRTPKPRMPRAPSDFGPEVKKSINLSKPKAEVSNGMVSMWNRKTLAPNRKHLRQLREAEKVAAERRKARAPQPEIPGVKHRRKPVGGDLQKRMNLDFSVPMGPKPQVAGSRRRKLR